MEHPRYFTLEQANQQLPWLAPHVERIVALRADLQALHRQMQEILRRGRGNGHNGVEQEMAAKRKEIDAVAEQLSSRSQAVHERGIILRDPDRGLIDFPALKDGREVYLCWVMGEEQVRFWHEVDAGFQGRQPL